MSSVKLEFEYVLDCSPKTLFTHVTFQSGFTTWFADSVDRVGESFNFFWGKYSEMADLIYTDNTKIVRYQWEKDRGTENYFEFKVEQSDVALVVSMIITVVTSPDEADEQQGLWDDSIDKLKRGLGIK